MPSFARLDNSNVVELITAEAATPQGQPAVWLNNAEGVKTLQPLFHSDLFWKECDPSVQVGWYFDGSTFAPKALSKDDLISLANAKQNNVANSGFTMNNIAGGSWLFATDSASLSAMHQTSSINTDPTTLITWQLNSAIFVSMTVGDLRTVSARINQFIEATFSTLKTVIDAINKGTITTMDQINAFAWPLNHG